MNKELIMLIVTNKLAYAGVVIDNNVIYLDKLNEYYRYSKLVKKNAPSTIKSKLEHIYHFWLWTLSNVPDKDEDIQLYFARYLTTLETGFTIVNINNDVEYTLYESKPKQPSTIEKEKRAVESFFKYIGSFKSSEYNLEKNFMSYAKRAKYSKGSSYGLKMSSIMQKTLLDDVSILPSKSSSFQTGDIRAFPFKLYDELLQLAKPRERLIYLLCGACAARANQALNLTFYDLDYSSKNVWLIDPRSNDQLGYQGISRKQFLKQEYNIGIEEDKNHNKFGFKYPIPTLFKSRMPLMWLNENYKEIFFDTLAQYNPLPESLRVPRHPFLFVRSTGKRLSYDEVIKSFKKHIAILAKKYPELKYRLDGLGIHSLRHMFGSVMATVEAKMIMAGETNTTFIRWFTTVAMGHSLQSRSTDIYFNRPWDIDVELGEFFQTKVKEINQQQYIETIRKEYDVKRW